jgi:predicted RNase H-like HicB family nuclease
MASYIALIHKEENSEFGVSFPDFPGCVTAGKSLDEAAKAASEALGGHIDTMREFGEVIPAPLALDQVLADPENAEATAVVVIVAGAPQAKIVRANISVPEDVLGAIDAAAKAKGMNRSKFLIEAAKSVMNG